MWRSLLLLVLDIARKDSRSLIPLLRILFLFEGLLTDTWGLLNLLFLKFVWRRGKLRFYNGFFDLPDLIHLRLLLLGPHYLSGCFFDDLGLGRHHPTILLVGATNVTRAFTHSH